MSDATIVITRVFNAPRELVYDAWIDPEQVANWYGPSSFTNRDVEVDARPGGRWQVVMVSPEGLAFPTGGEFIEVDPPAKLSYRSISAELSEKFGEMVRAQLEAIGEDPDQNIEDGVVTVTFDDHPDGTLLTIHTLFPSAAVCKAVGNMRMEDGWNESLDTLTRVLAEAV